VITGSTGQGVVQLSGSIQTAGFLSALGIGNATVINHPTTVPENFNSLLYGPITVKHTGSLTITEGSAVKIKDIQDA
jgi:hypothetical protein